MKSFFVPKTVLQGDVIPIHAIWEGIDYNSIKIEFSPFLKLGEIYNIATGGIKEEQHWLLIRKLEVDGYVGMILESRQLDEAKQLAWLDFTFIGKDGKMIEKRHAEIFLFRPKIILLDETSKIIKVDLSKGVVHDRIRIRNAGDGTAIITFKMRKESELKKHLPERINEFRERFYRDTKKNLASVKKKYPQYSTLITQYIRLLEKPDKGDQYFKEMANIWEDLIEGIETNEEFGWAFIEALSSAFMKHIHLATIFEDLLEYLGSIISKKVLIYDPIEVISVSTQPSGFALDVSVTDLVGGDYPKIRLPKMKIVSNKPGEVQVHRLFEWK